MSVSSGESRPIVRSGYQRLSQRDVLRSRWKDGLVLDLKTDKEQRRQPNVHIPRIFRSDDQCRRYPIDRLREEQREHAGRRRLNNDHVDYGSHFSDIQKGALIGTIGERNYYFNGVDNHTLLYFLQDGDGNHYTEFKNNILVNNGAYSLREGCEPRPTEVNRLLDVVTINGEDFVKVEDRIFEGVRKPLYQRTENGRRLDQFCYVDERKVSFASANADGRRFEYSSDPEDTDELFHVATGGVVDFDGSDYPVDSVNRDEVSLRNRSGTVFKVGLNDITKSTASNPAPVSTSSSSLSDESAFDLSLEDRRERVFYKGTSYFPGELQEGGWVGLYESLNSRAPAHYVNVNQLENSEVVDGLRIWHAAAAFPGSSSSRSQSSQEYHSSFEGSWSGQEDDLRPHKVSWEDDKLKGSGRRSHHSDDQKSLEQQLQDELADLFRNRLKTTTLVRESAKTMPGDEESHRQPKGHFEYPPSVDGGRSEEDHNPDFQGPDFGRGGDYWPKTKPKPKPKLGAIAQLVQDRQRGSVLDKTRHPTETSPSDKRPGTLHRKPSSRQEEEANNEKLRGILKKGRGLVPERDVRVPENDGKNAKYKFENKPKCKSKEKNSVSDVSEKRHANSERENVVPLTGSIPDSEVSQREIPPPELHPRDPVRGKRTYEDDLEGTKRKPSSKPHPKSKSQVGEPELQTKGKQSGPKYTPQTSKTGEVPPPPPVPSVGSTSDLQNPLSLKQSLMDDLKNYDSNNLKPVNRFDMPKRDKGTTPTNAVRTSTPPGKKKPGQPQAEGGLNGQKGGQKSSENRTYDPKPRGEERKEQQGTGGGLYGKKGGKKPSVSRSKSTENVDRNGSNDDGRFSLTRKGNGSHGFNAAKSDAETERKSVLSEPSQRTQIDRRQSAKSVQFQGAVTEITAPIYESSYDSDDQSVRSGVRVRRDQSSYEIESELKKTPVYHDRRMAEDIDIVLDDFRRMMMGQPKKTGPDHIETRDSTPSEGGGLYADQKPDEHSDHESASTAVPNSEDGYSDASSVSYFETIPPRRRERTDSLDSRLSDIVLMEAMATDGSEYSEHYSESTAAQSSPSSEKGSIAEYLSQNRGKGQPASESGSSSETDYVDVMPYQAVDKNPASTNSRDQEDPNVTPLPATESTAAANVNAEETSEQQERWVQLPGRFVYEDGKLFGTDKNGKPVELKTDLIELDGEGSTAYVREIRPGTMVYQVEEGGTAQVLVKVDKIERNSGNILVVHFSQAEGHPPPFANIARHKKVCVTDFTLLDGRAEVAHSVEVKRHSGVPENRDHKAKTRRDPLSMSMSVPTDQSETVEFKRHPGETEDRSKAGTRRDHSPDSTRGTTDSSQRNAGTEVLNGDLKDVFTSAIGIMRKRLSGETGPQKSQEEQEEGSAWDDEDVTSQSSSDSSQDFDEHVTPNMSVTTMVNKSPKPYNKDEQGKSTYQHVTAPGRGKTEQNSADSPEGAQADPAEQELTANQAKFEAIATQVIRNYSMQNKTREQEDPIQHDYRTFRALVENPEKLAALNSARNVKVRGVLRKLKSLNAKNEAHALLSTRGTGLVKAAFPIRGTNISLVRVGRSERGDKSTMLEDEQVSDITREKLSGTNLEQAILGVPKQCHFANGYIQPRIGLDHFAPYGEVSDATLITGFKYKDGGNSVDIYTKGRGKDKITVPKYAFHADSNRSIDLSEAEAAASGNTEAIFVWTERKIKV